MNLDRARVPLVVVHFGPPRRLRRLIDSLEASDDRPLLGPVLIVWNDPAEPHGLPESTALERILLTPDENLGFAGGADAGLREAERRGFERAWLLNNDVEVEAGALAELSRALDAHPRWVLAGPRILTDDGDSIWHDGGELEWPKAKVVSRGYGESPDWVGMESEVDFVCGCAPLVRLAAYREVGGFDPDYFLYYEDADLSVRARAAGWAVGHVPEATVRHAGGATAGSEARYYQLRNRLRFLEHHAPDPSAVPSARREIETRARRRALGMLVRGQVRNARLIWQALADAKAGRSGRRR